MGLPLLLSLRTYDKSCFLTPTRLQGLQTPILFSEQRQPLLDQQLFKAAASENNGGQLSPAHNHHCYYNHQHLNTMEWVKPRSQQDLPAEPKVAYKYVHFKILTICICRLGKYFTSLKVVAINMMMLRRQHLYF